jgi:LPS sulfotransferase NodH
LTTTGAHGQPDEWLNQDRWQWNCARFGLSEDASMTDMVRALQQGLSSLNGVFAHKILRYSYEPFIERMRQLDGFGELAETEILKTLFPGLQCIYIRRRDRLAQAISLLKAEQSAVWHINEKRLNHVDPVHFKWTGIDGLVRDLQEQERRWEELIKCAGVPCVEVFYEDLIREREAEMNRIINALEIKSPAFRLDFKQLAHRPTRDGTNKQWRSRYEELSGKVSASSGPVHTEGDIRHAHIAIDRVELEVAAGEVFSQRIRVTNLSPRMWHEYGNADGSGWIKVASQIIDGEGLVLTKGADWRELPHAVHPQGSFELDIPQKAPPQAGTYRVWVDLVVGKNDWFHSHCQCGVEARLQVRPSARQVFITDWLGEDLLENDQQVYRSSWFGDFHLIDFPDVYHFGLGLLRCFGGGHRDGEFVFESAHYGRLATHPDRFPELWSYDEGARLRWHQGTMQPPFFDIEKDGEWEPWNAVDLRQKLAKGTAYFGIDSNVHWNVEVPWFGRVDLRDFPAIEHAVLGKVWCGGPGAAEDSFFFKKQGTPWFWTNEQNFPLFCRMDSKVWLSLEQVAEELQGSSPCFQ